MIKVKELLNENNWIKRHMALNRNNEVIDSLLPEACKWCLLGAIEKCYGGTEIFYHVCGIVESKIVDIISLWNDDPTRKWNDVKKLIEELDI